MFGQIGVMPGAHSPFGFVICLITRAHAYHCIVDVGGGRCVSADLKGVHNRPVSEFPEAIWSDFQMTWGQAAMCAQFALNQVGKPYALTDDILIGVERIFRFKFPRWVRQRFADDGQWQCAELSDAALNAAGIVAFPGRDVVGDVEPADFERLFIAKGWHTERDFTKYAIRPW